MNSSSEDSNTLDNDTSSIDLVHYWNLFWRNKFLIILSGFLFAVPVVFYMSGLPSTYESTASLLIEENKSNITSIQDLYGIDTQSRTYVSTQFELLHSRNLLEKVINNLNLLESPAFVGQRDNGNDDNKLSAAKEYLANLLPFVFSGWAESDSDMLEQNDENLNPDVHFNLVLNHLKRNLSISPVNGTSIVNIKFKATDPRLAAQIANEIANTYIASDMEQRISATQLASRWLSERVASMSETLKDSELRLQNFLEREQIINVEGINSLTVQEMDEINAQVIEAQFKRASLEENYIQIQELVTPTLEELLSLSFVHNSQSVQTAKSAVEEIEQKLAELSNRYGRNHPQMIALRAEKNALDGTLNWQIEQALIAVEQDYQSALLNEQNLKAQLDLSKNEFQASNRKGYQLRELEREVETNRQLYDMFFTRIRETQETDDLLSTNAVVIDPAVSAIYPTGPQRRRNVLLALIVGLAFGGGCVYLKDFLDNTVKNHEDIERLLRVPMLGVSPFVKVRKKQLENISAETAVIREIKASCIESFRTIRTGITLSSIDQPYKIISVSSSMPNEGKSTISLNIASVIGQMSRVLIIDTDLRKPVLHELLELPPASPGLSNFLASSNAISECVYSIPKLNVDIMPAGHIVPNPLELLSSSKFKRLLENLSSRYDQIILDTPPTRAVSDSLILGNLSDALVFVVKADATPVKIVKRELLRLKSADVNVIGVVLSQLEIEKNTDYGGYYDSYGYSKTNQTIISS